MMRNNPERVAWTVLFGAFGIFLILCAAVPIGARSYLLDSTTPQTAMLEVIDGIVRVQERDAVAPIAVTVPLSLSEGSTLETDANSRGILTFHDGSTVTIFPGTALTLREMRTASFDWGRQPIALTIDQVRGRIRVGAAQLYYAAPGAPTQRVFRIITPHFSARITEGSFAVDVYADSSQITVRDGTAEVTSQGRTVSVGRRQRTVVTRGEVPLAPMPAAQDLIVNGDFKDPLPRGWPVLDSIGPPGAAVGSVEVVAFADRHALHILRTGALQTSAITGIIQQINREVSDFRTVRLSADIRLHSHSLSGGGILSSEYPLILRLRYRDVYGSETEKVYGFYYQNTTNNPTVNGELVPQDVWVPFESDLIESLDPKPFYITSLQIYASGWDYDSFVSNVRLIVE